MYIHMYSFIETRGEWKERYHIPSTIDILGLQMPMFQILEQPSSMPHGHGLSQVTAENFLSPQSARLTSSSSEVSSELLCHKKLIKFQSYGRTWDTDENAWESRFLQFPFSRYLENIWKYMVRYGMDIMFMEQGGILFCLASNEMGYDILNPGVVAGFASLTCLHTLLCCDMMQMS